MCAIDVPERRTGSALVSLYHWVHLLSALTYLRLRQRSILLREVSMLEPGQYPRGKQCWPLQVPLMLGIFHIRSGALGVASFEDTHQCGDLIDTVHPFGGHGQSSLSHNKSAEVE